MNIYLVGGLPRHKTDFTRQYRMEFNAWVHEYIGRRATINTHFKDIMLEPMFQIKELPKVMIRDIELFKDENGVNYIGDDRYIKEIDKYIGMYYLNISNRTTITKDEWIKIPALALLHAIHRNTVITKIMEEFSTILPNALLEVHPSNYYIQLDELSDKIIAAEILYDAHEFSLTDVIIGLNIDERYSPERIAESIYHLSNYERMIWAKITPYKLKAGFESDKEAAEYILNNIEQGYAHILKDLPPNI